MIALCRGTSGEENTEQIKVFFFFSIIYQMKSSGCKNRKEETLLEGKNKIITPWHIAAGSLKK